MQKAVDLTKLAKKWQSANCSWWWKYRFHQLQGHLRRRRRRSKVPMSGDWSTFWAKRPLQANLQNHWESSTRVEQNIIFCCTIMIKWHTLPFCTYNPSLLPTLLSTMVMWGTNIMNSNRLFLFKTLHISKEHNSSVSTTPSSIPVDFPWIFCCYGYTSSTAIQRVSVSTSWRPIGT